MLILVFVYVSNNFHLFSYEHPHQSKSDLKSKLQKFRISQDDQPGKENEMKGVKVYW